MQPRRGKSRSAIKIAQTAALNRQHHHSRNEYAVADDNTDLVFAISKILSDGQPHTAGELAFMLNVSSKTIRRKLHVMRDEMKLPILPTRKGFVADDATGNHSTPAFSP